MLDRMAGPPPQEQIGDDCGNRLGNQEDGYRIGLTIGSLGK